MLGVQGHLSYVGRLGQPGIQETLPLSVEVMSVVTVFKGHTSQSHVTADECLTGESAKELSKGPALGKRCVVLPGSLGQR